MALAFNAFLLNEYMCVACHAPSGCHPLSAVTFCFTPPRPFRQLRAATNHLHFPTVQRTILDPQNHGSTWPGSVLHHWSQAQVRYKPHPRHELLRHAVLTTSNSSSGDPTGEIVKVAGKWDAYIAKPPAGKGHAGAGILFVPDVIGIWQNSKLMADQFAANGYFCMVVDEFNGDALSLNRPADFDFQGWVAHGSDGKNAHTPEGVDPIIEAAIKAMKEEYGITKLGAAGYCFGAKVRTRRHGDERQVDAA
jgi:hypothetical protein